MRIYNSSANPNQWRTWTPPKAYLPKEETESRSPKTALKTLSPHQERLEANKSLSGPSERQLATKPPRTPPSLRENQIIAGKCSGNKEEPDSPDCRQPPIHKRSPSTPNNTIGPSVESRVQCLSLQRLADSPASSLTTFSNETTTTTTTTTTKRSTTTARYLVPVNGFRFDISPSETSVSGTNSMSDEDGISSSTISTNSTCMMRNSSQKTPSPPPKGKYKKKLLSSPNDSSPYNTPSSREARRKVMVYSSSPTDEGREQTSPFFVLQSKPSKMKYSTSQRNTTMMKKESPRNKSPAQDIKEIDDKYDPPCPMPEALSPPSSPENYPTPKLALTTTTEAESDDSSSLSPWESFPNHGIFPEMKQESARTNTSPCLLASKSIPFNPYVHDGTHSDIVEQLGAEKQSGNITINNSSSRVMAYNRSAGKHRRKQISSNAGFAMQELRRNSPTDMKQRKRRNGNKRHASRQASAGKGKIILPVKKGSTIVQGNKTASSMLFPKTKFESNATMDSNRSRSKLTTKIPSPPHPVRPLIREKAVDKKKVYQEEVNTNSKANSAAATTSFLIKKYPNLFRKYSAMFKVGFSLEGVTKAMERDSVDPTLIDLITSASQVHATSLP